MTAPEPVVSAPAPPPATATATAAANSGLGRTVLIAGIVLFAVSITVSVVSGLIGAPYAERGPTGFRFNFQIGDPDPVVSALALAGVLHVLLGGLIGTWVIVQGIVAVAMNRGRRAGIVALVLGVITPGISLIVYLVVIFVAG